MQRAARLAAAVEVLDTVLVGQPAEQVLLHWARGHRFAGSGDREAIRDSVFTALRCLRSHAALGGAETGRGLILGQMAEAGEDMAALFTGEGHAPAPLTDVERAHLAGPPEMPRNVALDCPDWLAPQLEASLGADFAPVMQALRHRAPAFLRVNVARCTRAEAAARLAAEGVETQPAPLAETALEVTAGARGLRVTRAYTEGLVELQDAASQAVAAALPLAPGASVLDYCAGGGGKALAMAALCPEARILAHDAAPGRMADLPARAARAGARIACADAAVVEAAAPFDLVLCDVPCSGSGAWRRAPQGKWRLDAAGLAALLATQAAILDAASRLVARGGALAYVTCSLLDAENAGQVTAFRERGPGWQEVWRLRLTPLDGGDGFFLALLRRE